MEKTTKANSNTPTSPQDLEKTLKATLVIVFCLAIIALIGAGFGIYGTIQANRALHYLESDDSSLDIKSDDLDEEALDDETSFTKPTTADDITYASLVYNNGQDYIDIINDGADSNIDYYTVTDDDETIENSVTTGVTDILNYIYENDLNYLGENDYNEDDIWSLEVDTEDGYSYVGGTSTAPDWFNELLKKLDIDKNGYQSKK